MGAGLNLLGGILRAGNDQAIADRARAYVTQIQQADPTMGVLVVYRYEQPQVHPDSVIVPDSVLVGTSYGKGRDEWEALADYRSQAQIRRNTVLTESSVWHPPRVEPSIAQIRTPFPTVAVATFAPGQARLQGVSWGGVRGFNDDGEESLDVPPGITPRFLVLSVPEDLPWLWGQIERTTALPLTNRSTADGGAISAVDLDPWLFWSDLAAVCVFPADDATAALFASTPPTYDRNQQLWRRHANFRLVRWVRPENIQVLQRLSGRPSR